VLHEPPELLPFGQSLDLISRKVKNVPIVPVAIRYQMSVHERPECFISFGSPVSCADEAHLGVERLLASSSSLSREAFSLLAIGTKDVNERMDMRNVPFLGKRTRDR